MNKLGAEVDKGASWIHGANPSHVIKKLADDFNLTTFATSAESEGIYLQGDDIADASYTKFIEV